MSVEGYVQVRHNQVRDFLASQLSQVYKDVEVESHLQREDIIGILQGWSERLLQHQGDEAEC